MVKKLEFILEDEMEEPPGDSVESPPEEELQDCEVCFDNLWPYYIASGFLCSSNMGRWKILDGWDYISNIDNSGDN